jgi:zinc transport system ATP-binding protein
VSAPAPPAPRQTPAAGTPVVRVRDARVALGGRPVLHGVDLDVAPGQVVALLGGNGSGKSTLVRAVVGLVPLTGGSVELFGVPGRDFADWHRIGYVPQRTSAASGVPATAREVVASGRLRRGRWWRPARAADRAAVDRALDAVGLSALARRRVSDLSGGQQQRVLIARALCAEPDLLILDEAMAGVDVASQRAVAGLLADMVGAGRTVLLVAHEMGPVEALVSRAVVLRDGRVVHTGAVPAARGHHDAPDHDHVHPHAPEIAGWWS